MSEEDIVLSLLEREDFESGDGEVSLAQDLLSESWLVPCPPPGQKKECEL